MVRAASTGNSLCVAVLCVVWFVPAALAGDAGRTGPHADADLARRILDDTGLRGGLIVHLGCSDGRLTAALDAGESYLVHGLDADAENVRRAREHVRALGIYGPVSVDRFDGKRLPYAENLVNLVVAEDLRGVPMEEVTRVLAPGGVLYAKQEGGWRKTVKPRPDGIDEWTHFLHDASGNAVAHDDVVGPPRHLQWNAQPRFTLSHEHTPSINAVVSSAGRIFYIVDEAPIVSARRLPRWHLVARDAFNGLLLWRQPITTWYPHLINWGRTPYQLQRKLVAAADRVYVTLGYHAPLSAVDAATGETLQVYDETRGAEEIVLHQGTLLVAVRDVTDERVAELEKWVQLVQRRDSPAHTRDSAEPLVRRFSTVERKADTAILALDAESGSVLWKKGGDDTAGLKTLSLCAEGDRVFYQKGQDVVCLDRKTGRKRWSAAAPPLRLVYDGCVVCANGQTVTALAADSGETRWTRDASLCNIRDAFVAGGALWLGGFKPYDTGRRHTGPVWGPYFATKRDLSTGEMLMHVEPENPGHHHRCYLNKATDRYILGGRRGTEFIDLASGEVLWHSWARGVCRYGVMPCNGLLYAPPHACGCYIAAKLTGFNALASGSPGRPATTDEPSRLQRGAAYDTRPAASAARPSADWPTYRHDAGRSGVTPTRVAPALRRRWQVEVGPKLTSLTVADGRVFVGSVEDHRVAAIDADSGKPLWQFTAGARVDSPPTVHEGRAVFGSRDGCVYSLRAADGALAWRLRAARQQRSIAACGQLESAWPVLGSVLVDDGVAYVTAGRSSYLDGGIDLCRVDSRTGKILSTTAIYSPDPETGKQPKHSAPAFVAGARADVLSADRAHVYLRDTVFDRRGVELPEGEPHLFTLTDFLDDSWTHRSYWIFGTECSISTGCSGRDRKLIYGRLLAFDDSAIYGYGRAGVHWSNQLEDGAYRMFAVKRGETKAAWQKPVGVRVRAMLLAGDVLFVAGAATDSGDGPASPDESRESLLVALSASDGTELAQCPLDAPPVFDGMAAAAGRLYLALKNGNVVCLDEKGPG